VRPAHLLHHSLQPRDVEKSPVLAHLGAVDAALDALLLALAVRHPRALRITANEPYDLELRRSRTVTALAIALQGAMAEYQENELERIAIDNLDGRAL
jgi:hypothetical protein